MTAQKRYWLTALVKSGGNPKITHNESMWLKAYFDEKPLSDDPGEHKEGSGIRVPAEKASLKTLSKNGEQQFDFELTEEEYKANDFKLYFWGEPYGRVAFRKAGVQEGLAVGRLEVKPSDCQKGGLPRPPANSMAGDEQIICEFEAVQSVVNFIVDEINGNGNSPETQRMRALNEAAGKEPFFRSWAPRGLAEDLLGCMTHSNEKGNVFDRNVTKGWDILFCGPERTGGQWDHKPRIRPIWGALNKLGNSGIVYFYDTWSNIHYGWIGAKGGFKLPSIEAGASRAQALDSQSLTGDDFADAQAIRYGYNLGASKTTIIIQDIINIINRHSDWDFCTRFPEHNLCQK